MAGFRRQGGEDLLLKPGIEQQNRQQAVLVHQRANKPAAQRLARGFHQCYGALVGRRGFDQRFQNGAEIAYRDTLPQQLLKNPPNLAEG